MEANAPDAVIQEFADDAEARTALELGRDAECQGADQQLRCFGIQNAGLLAPPDRETQGKRCIAFQGNGFTADFWAYAGIVLFLCGSAAVGAVVQICFGIGLGGLNLIQIPASHRCEAHSASDAPIFFFISVLLLFHSIPFAGNQYHQPLRVHDCFF